MLKLGLLTNGVMVVFVSISLKLRNRLILFIILLFYKIYLP